MANARKCDCCGNLYEAYNVAQNRFKISGFTPLNIDSQGEYYANKFVDLCPVCVKPLHDILDKVKRNIGGK